MKRVHRKPRTRYYVALINARGFELESVGQFFAESAAVKWAILHGKRSAGYKDECVGYRIDKRTNETIYTHKRPK